MARICSRTGKKGSLWCLDYSVDGRRMRKPVGRRIGYDGGELEHVEVGFMPITSARRS